MEQPRNVKENDNDPGERNRGQVNQQQQLQNQDEGCKFPRLLILYASQTGTAEDCGERVGYEARRRHFSSVVVMSCDEYPIQNFVDERLALFFIATTGQGDHPDNMRDFFRSILNRKLQSGVLGHLQFAVCGFGDSSYQKFNFAAKKVFRRLVQLGARALIEPVWADEQHDLGVDGLIDPWLETFWKASAHLTKHPHLDPLPDAMPPHRYSVRVYKESDELQPYGLQQLNVEENSDIKYLHYNSKDTASRNSLKVIATPPWVAARVISQERVTTQDHFQDVRLLRLTCSGQRCTAPGDVAVVLPRNMPDRVQSCLDMFPHIHPEQKITLSNGSAKVPLYLQHRWTTFRELATRHFDLNFVPKRSFFSVYKHFCSKSDTAETSSRYSDESSTAAEQLAQYWEKLDEFSRAAGQPYLVDYVIRPKRTVLEVFDDFPLITAKLDLQDLLTLIPAIRPRYYSVANSMLKYPNEVHLLYAVVNFKTIIKKPRTGLCTRFLKELQTGDTVEMYIRKGTFQFPVIQAESQMKWRKGAVVMIGPGTGVAPFRALIQEFAAAGGADKPMMLFFGCRNSRKDYYFADEWLSLEERGVLRVVTAFSRDQEQKIYVQQRIKEYKEELVKMAEDEDSLAVYICGNAARMVGDVLETLQEIWGVDRVERMQNRKVIQIEAWA